MNSDSAEPVTLSVIIASYNRASFLPSCVASLREAGVRGLEIVIVDDGSTDDTRTAVESLGPGIRYLYHENRGLSAARNTGILAATGKYVAYLDSDDYWLPGVAEKLVAFLDRHPEIGAVFTEAKVGNAQDGYSSWIRAAGQQAFQDLPSTEIEPGFRILETLPFYRGLLFRNAIFTGAIIQRRELVIEAGLFEPELKATGDWELWLRMVHRAKFAYYPEALAIYTRHAENMTNDEDRMRQAFCDSLRVHLRWATVQEPRAPGTLARLFHTLTELAVTARWKRNWPQYWLLRGFCDRDWPIDLPRPAVLTERIWPKLVYPLKDIIDRAVRKWDQLRTLSAVLGLTAAVHLLVAGKVGWRNPVGLRSLWLHGFRFPLYFRPCSSDPEVIKQVFVRREYEASAKERDVRLILDCGANIGCSSFYFLHRYPNAHLIAVEPDPGNFRICRRNLAPFAHRVTLVNGGVWSSAGPLKVVRGAFADGREWTFQVRAALSGETADCQSTTIEALLDQSGKKSIDLLKIDIEGAELELFTAEPDRWLRRTRHLVIELHGWKCEQAFRQALAGYSYHSIQSGELTICQELQARTDPLLAG